MSAKVIGGVIMAAFLAVFAVCALILNVLTPAKAASGSCGGTADAEVAAVKGTAAGLNAIQQSNARIIAGAALARGLGRPGVLVVEVTAYTEDSLLNDAHGDASGPDSTGLYQQMPSWGPWAVRMDPAGATGLFLDRVVTIPNWQNQDPANIAEQVEQSEFDGKHTRDGQVLGYGDNYRANLAIAAHITDQLLGTDTGVTVEAVAATLATFAPATTAPAATSGASADQGGADDSVASSAAGSAAPVSGAGCQAVGQVQQAAYTGTATTSGYPLTIPTAPDVDPAVAGQTIYAPTAAMARGLQAGFALLTAVKPGGGEGTPYVYGGGTGGGGPDEGCARAGGSSNSCQGIVGLDCSGMTGYVLAQAGFHIPDNSGAQRGAGTDVPRAQGRPGDIIGYSGHVAIYLGFIGGKDYLLEAPEPGEDVHIRAAYWSNEGQPADADLHRYWDSVAA